VAGAGREPVARRGEPGARAGDHPAELGEDEEADEGAAEGPPAAPVRGLGLAQVDQHHDEDEEDDDRAGVEQDLDRAEELRALEDEEPGDGEEGDDEGERARDDPARRDDDDGARDRDPARGRRGPRPSSEPLPVAQEVGLVQDRLSRRS